MTARMKHIYEAFPAEKLPKELREGLPLKAYVRITIEMRCEQEAVTDLISFIGAAPGVYSKPEEAVETIRALRDEW